MKMIRTLSIAALALILTVAAEAQPAKKPSSPRGVASTQVGGSWVAQENGRTSYEGGQWIEIDYGRPILRGRDGIFGSGADYGKKVDAGAEVWRLGANQTTRLKTEAELTIHGVKLAPGEYSLFVLLADGAWTLVVSTQPYQETYDRENKSATWGSYNYDAQFDVVRAPMQVATTPYATDQFTIGFRDVSAHGGTIAMEWDHTVATVAFTLAH